MGGRCFVIGGMSITPQSLSGSRLRDFPEEGGTLPLQFAPINFVRAARIEILPLRPGKFATDGSLILRPRDDATEPARPIEHLDAERTRHKIMAERIHSHAIAGALHFGD